MHIAPTYACTHVHVHTHIDPWPGCVMDKSKLCETHAAQTRFCYPGRNSEASRATRCGAHYLRTRYLREQVWHADLPLSRHGQRVQQGRVNSRKRLSCRCPSLWERPPLWIFVWGFSFNTSNCFNWGTAYAQLSSNLKCEIQWVLANAHTHSVPTQSPLLSRCSPSPVPRQAADLLAAFSRSPCNWPHHTGSHGVCTLYTEPCCTVVGGTYPSCWRRVSPVCHLPPTMAFMWLLQNSGWFPITAWHRSVLSFPSYVVCAGKRAGEPIPRYSFYFCDVCLPPNTSAHPTSWL